MDIGGLGFETVTFATSNICPSCGKRGKTFVLKEIETTKLLTMIICFDCKLISNPRKAVCPISLNCKDLKTSINEVLKQKIVEGLPQAEGTLILLKIIDLLNETTPDQ